MKSFRHVLPWLAMVVVAGLIWWLWPRTTSPSDAGNPNNREHPRSGAPESRPAVDSGHGSPRKSLAGSSLESWIADTQRNLESSRNRAQSAAILKELHEKLSAADSLAAATAIRTYLDSGSDIATRLPLVVGAEGHLDTAPTLRIFLLDLLPSIDPDAALELARSVMDETPSPDEYALALRNLAWSDLEGDLKAEVSDRFNQMIESGDWCESPSAGFLEALDAAVFLGDKRTFESIAVLNADSGESRATGLARGTFIALDRMVRQAPDLLGTELDGAIAGLPADTRASLMSRLDLGRDDHREAFVRYLSNPQVGEREQEYFAGLFPNGNYLHGNWLITVNDPTLSVETRYDADQSALEELDSLRAAGGDERMLKTIDRIQRRLRKMIHDADSAKAGGN